MCLYLNTLCDQDGNRVRVYMGQTNLDTKIYVNTVSLSDWQGDPLDLVDCDLPRIVQMFLEGDSITEDTVGEPSWTLFTANTFENKAVSGSELTLVNSRIAGELAASSGFDVIVVIGGVNDINEAVNKTGVDPVPAMQAAITNLISLADQYQVPLVVSTISPFGGTSLNTAQGAAWANEFNAWVLAQASSDVHVLDVLSILDADGDGTMDAAYVSNADFIHPNPVGDQALATAVDSLVASIVT